MNNLSNSIKKFVSNKNTVTILGLVLAIIILYFAYNMRINQKVALYKVPYAKQTIQPRTEITSDMIGYMEVPKAFLKGAYYASSDSLVGKYSNYNTIIAAGSLFYSDLVVDASVLPDSAFIKIPEGETVVNYGVNMDSTYANSMMPNDYINIYFKARDDSGTIMFGKFISNVKILDVKDSSGKHVFENTDEARVPAYMMFSLPEETHLLFRKAIYLERNYDVDLILVPNTQELTDKDTVYVSSDDIKNFINEKTKMVSVNEITSSTQSKVSGESTEKKNN